MHRYFPKSSKKCLGCRVFFYPLTQWLSLMYHDTNKYVVNQTCEYCNEQLLMFEKIIFPKDCENNRREEELKKNAEERLMQVEVHDNSGVIIATVNDEGQHHAESLRPKKHKSSERRHFYHVVCQDLI